MKTIQNKKAKYNFSLEDNFEAGIMLEGWEIKPVLDRKVNLEASHIVIKNGELFLLNALINPEHTASTHVTPNVSRTRKLLMHKSEIMKLIGKVEQKGYTLIPNKIYQKGRFIKVEISLAKGKKEHDKRETIKNRDLDMQAASVLKNNTRRPKI